MGFISFLDSWGDSRCSFLVLQRHPLLDTIPIRVYGHSDVIRALSGCDSTARAIRIFADGPTIFVLSTGDLESGDHQFL